MTEHRYGLTQFASIFGGRVGDPGGSGPIRFTQSLLPKMSATPYRRSIVFIPDAYLPIGGYSAR